MFSVQFTSKPFDRVATECLVVLCPEEIRPLQNEGALVDWRLNGRLSQVILQNRFAGQYGETLLIPSETRIKSSEILVVGLGKVGELTEGQWQGLLKNIFKTLTQKKTKDITLCLSPLFADKFEWRNNVRYVVSLRHDYPSIEVLRFAEPPDFVDEAKRRHMDFGLNVEVEFE